MSDYNIMDPELSFEMVKLLMQELKVARAQCCEIAGTCTPSSGGLTHERAHALIAENDALKADNTVLLERIATLQDELIQVSSIKSEEGLPIPLQHAEPTPHTREEVARLRAENEDLVRGKEEALRNEEMLSNLQEKYRRSKAKVNEYNEILHELRDALLNCTQELEQSRRVMVSEVDFKALLKDLPYEPVEGQPPLSSIQPYPRGAITELHKNVIGTGEGLHFLNYNEVIWSSSGIALGLVVKPTFQYNPKVPGGKWTKLEDNFDVGKPIDVCYFSGKSIKASRYLGTYKRVEDQGTLILASESLKFLDHNKLEHASKRTTLFPDLVPPYHTQMIKNMYKQGVIKLECFVVRCVAFNRTFAEQLEATCTSFVQVPDNAASKIAPKRKRDQKSMDHPTRNKKRKH